MIDLSPLSISLLIFLGTYLFMWIVLCFAHLFGKYNSEGLPSQHRTVSVIIPARTEERVVRDIMRDVADQLYKNIELLIVAHNCTDNTYQVALEESNRLQVTTRVLRLETQDSGKGLALRFGASQATGELIAYFDADNRIPPTAIGSLVSWVDRGFDGAQGRLISKNPRENKLTYAQHIEFLVYHSVFCGGKFRLGFNSGIGGTGVLVSKRALTAIGGFRNLLIEDFDAVLRLTLAGFRIAYARNAIIYDEKPPSWNALLKQRARWIAGHRQLWRLYSLKAKLRLLKYPVDFLYLHGPLTIVALLISFTLTISAPMLPQVTFFALPTYVFLVIMIPSNLIFSLILHKEDKTISATRLFLFPYVLFAFSFHWFAAFFRSFFIKGWTDTKTEHGYLTTLSTGGISMASEPHPVKSNLNKFHA